MRKILIILLLLPSAAGAESLEGLWENGSLFEDFLQLPTSEILAVDEDPERDKIKKALEKLGEKAVKMREAHLPLRRDLIKLEAAKSPYKADDKEGRAKREPAIIKLLDVLNKAMPGQTKFAEDLEEAMEALLKNPNLKKDKELLILLGLAHDQVIALYKIDPLKEKPKLGDKPHPLAQWTDYLPDRVEIAVDQFDEIGVGKALGGKLKEAKKLVQAYNKAMYKMHHAMHELEEHLAGEEHDEDEDHDEDGQA